MGESVASRPTLEVSVSFGKFENDSLSWEKWSTFSPNKYLEEVGKCSTPGSVAQKKAYFEAHYKKIAARKAELLDQEKQIETDPSRSDDRNCQDHTGSCSERVEHKTNLNSVGAAIDLECQSSEVKEHNEELNGKPEICESSHIEEATSVKDESLLNGSHDIIEQPLQVDIASECQSSLMLQYGEALNDKLNSDDFDNIEEAALVKNEGLDMVKQPLQGDNERGNTPETESKDNISKLDGRNVSQKVNPTKKERNLAVIKKRKPEPAIPKSPKITTPGSSKPKSTSIAMSAPMSSIKKTSASSLPRSKNPSVGESKRVAPTSLHLSLSLGSATSDSASFTTNRKSIIMEQMGDKDIVKRAFKTFQNNFNQPRHSNEGKSYGPKQVSTKGSENKASTSMTSRKENERVRKAAEKINPQRGQVGAKWNSISSGSLKGAGVDERCVKVASSSVGLRSDEGAERRKEFFKKLEEKSNAKEAAKEEKEAEIKKLRQRLNFKAKPMPGFYRAQGTTRSPSEKEVVKNEIRTHW